MILFRSKPTHLPSKAANDLVRKSLELRFDWKANQCWLLWGDEYRSRTTGKWDQDHCGNTGIILKRMFALGPDHFWYDGPHCGFHLGFLQILWENQTCRKCTGMEDTPGIWIQVYRTKPGEVGPGSYWACQYDCWLHLHESLPRLLWEVATEFKHDRHLVG